VTQCEIDETAGFHVAKPREITTKRQKINTHDHFCLTESVGEGYFAGSSPSGCGGKEAPIATRCGTNVELRGSAWGWPVDFPRVERCV